MADRSFKQKSLLFFKGMAMGAADVVPGVSGGTIAFITGIYEELLESISRIGPQTIKILRKEGIAAAWKQVNGPFLLNLILGILVSIASLAFIITYLLEHHPIPVWSFFFGLIIASIILVGKKLKTGFTLLNIVGLISGTLVAYFITIASAVSSDLSLPYVFLCGMIAITAMILPGISGSFILLLLGAYSGVLGSISEFFGALKSGDTALILSSGSLLGVFALGCVTGLLSFSKALNWMFKHAHDLTISILTGFLIGSLNKVWPWKITDEVFIKHEGTPKEEIVPLVQHNALPAEWAMSTNLDAQVGIAITMIVLGFLLIIVIEKFAPKSEKA